MQMSLYNVVNDAMSFASMHRDHTRRQCIGAFGPHAAYTKCQYAAPRHGHQRTTLIYNSQLSMYIASVSGAANADSQCIISENLYFLLIFASLNLARATIYIVLAVRNSCQFSTSPLSETPRSHKQIAYSRLQLTLSWQPSTQRREPRIIVIVTTSGIRIIIIITTFSSCDCELQGHEFTE